MKKKLMLSVILLVVCISSITILTTAWLRRSWAPEFSEEEIQVETSGSLVINLMGDDTHTPVNKITLNELFDEYDFYLKQVSNCSGESTDFFKIDYGNGVAGEETITSLVKTTTYLELGKTNGYIEGTFFLAGASKDSNTNKYIYLDPSSCIESLEDESLGYDVAAAIRVSISIQNTTGIFIIKNGTKSHTGITNDKTDGVFNAAGQKLYETGTTTVPSNLLETTSTNVYNIADLDGYDESDPDNFQFSQVLFMMTADDYRQITVRIWLEGADPMCVDAVSGHKLKIKLIFRSHDVTVNAGS